MSEKERSTICVIRPSRSLICESHNTTTLQNRNQTHNQKKVMRVDCSPGSVMVFSSRPLSPLKIPFFATVLIKLQEWRYQNYTMFCKLLSNSPRVHSRGRLYRRYSARQFVKYLDKEKTTWRRRSLLSNGQYNLWWLGPLCGEGSPHIPVAGYFARPVYCRWCGDRAVSNLLYCVIDMTF